MAALRILRASVWLKSSFQSCVELLNKDENVKREVRQMMQQERSFMWSGVRSLIDFLIPDCPLTYHIDTGCGFLQNVSNKTINGAGCLQDQVRDSTHCCLVSFLFPVVARWFRLSTS